MANKQPATGVSQECDGGRETASVGGEGTGSDETIDQHHASPHPEEETYVSWGIVTPQHIHIVGGDSGAFRAAVDSNNTRFFQGKDAYFSPENVSW